MKRLFISFSAAMVRAERGGRKTQTRRAVRGAAGDSMPALPSPYGGPGDPLLVKEAWRAPAAFDALPPRDLPSATPVWYDADGPAPIAFGAGRYRHARFMPQRLSRTTLEVLAVRIERLHDIGAADAVAEGLLREPDGWRGAAGLPVMRDPVAAYRTLWERINGAGAWQRNPWVWVIDFRARRPSVT